MTYINALRPAANRHWGAGPDSDHYDNRMSDRFKPVLSTR